MDLFSLERSDDWKVNAYQVNPEYLFLKKEPPSVCGTLERSVYDQGFVANHPQRLEVFSDAPRLLLFDKKNAEAVTHFGVGCSLFLVRCSTHLRED